MENNRQTSNDFHSQSRRQTGKSLDSYKRRKILPHINQQYDFRITNRLLIQKIINPRRDKTIIESLAASTCFNFYQKKTPIAHDQSVTSYRRKLITTSSIKKLKPHQNQICSEKERIFDSHKRQSKRCLENHEEDNAQNKQKKVEDQNELKDELAQSKQLETQPSSLRNNFVGKIVRNRSSRYKQLSKRKINLSNICDNFSFTQSQYMDNQIQEKQIKWNQRIPLKKRRRQISNLHQQRSTNKENHNDNKYSVAE